MKLLPLCALGVFIFSASETYAQDRIPVSVFEGQDYAQHPQIPTSTVPVEFQDMVNKKIASSPKYTFTMVGKSKLQLTLLALDTSGPNELAYAYSVAAYGPDNRLTTVTTLQLRTCNFNALDSCANSVLQALDAAVPYMPK